MLLSRRTRLLTARTELDLFLTESAEKDLRRTKHMIYAKANKQDTFLAHQLSRTEGPFRPVRLNLPTWGHTSNQVKVLQVFQTRLAELYASAGSFDPQQAVALLASTPASSLTEDQKVSLDAPIDIAEVKLAIKTLKLRKRPGPGGFTALSRHFSTSIDVSL